MQFDLTATEKSIDVKVPWPHTNCTDFLWMISSFGNKNNAHLIYLWFGFPLLHNFFLILTRRLFESSTDFDFLRFFRLKLKLENESYIRRLPTPSFNPDLNVQIILRETPVVSSHKENMELLNDLCFLLLPRPVNHLPGPLTKWLSRKAVQISHKT